MTKEELSAEAARIKENPGAIEALALMRESSMNGLVTADPTDADTIRLHQANVRAVDQFFSTLEGIIANGMPKKQAGIA